MKDSIKATGALKFHLNGVLVREEKNLVVTTGLNVIASRLKDATKGVVSHMAIGTGVIAANVANVELGTPKSARVAASSVTVTGAAIEVVATFLGSTYADAITEAGLFNHLTAGELISRVVFAPYNLASTDSLVITWTINFANA